MAFDPVSQARLIGAKQALIDRLTLLNDRFQAIGGRLSVPDYGGFRGPGVQAQLVLWRDQAVAAGKPFYAVAPAGTSKHETGDAGDAKIEVVPPGMTEAQAYKWLADEAHSVGLVAGYYFHGGPPSPGADIYHYELPSGLFTVPVPPAEIPVRVDPPWRGAGDDPGLDVPEEAIDFQDGDTSDGGASAGALVTALALVALTGVAVWRRFA